ncbi:MAG: hypothetical protein ACRCYO_19070, partial [Bacteroidia bacterium]
YYMSIPLVRDIANMNQIATAGHSLLVTMDNNYDKATAIVIDNASKQGYADASRAVFFNMIGLLVHRIQDLSKTEVQGTIPPHTNASVPAIISPIGIMIQFWIERFFFKQTSMTLPLIDAIHDEDILTFWIDNATAKPELRDFLIKIRAQYMSHI